MYVIVINAKKVAESLVQIDVVIGIFPALARPIPTTGARIS